MTVVGRPVEFAGAQPDAALAQRRYDAALRRFGFSEILYVYEPVAAAFFFARNLAQVNPITLAIGVCVFAITFLCEKIDMRLPGALVAMALATGAQAEDWPTRPLTMINPFAAGGPNDVVARLFAQRMGEVLGQPVIVENVGGAGGMNGADRVAKETKAAVRGVDLGEVLGGAGIAVAVGVQLLDERQPP